MSSKRKADMDAIQSALTSGTDIPEDNPGTFLPSGPIGDVVPAGSPAETPEQQKANKLAEDVETEDLKLAKEQESLIKAQLQATALATRNALGSIQNGIGGVAIPGGLLLPLVVLGIFLMLLVQINGNTRLGWLWLVMTGNAEVGDPNAAPLGTGTGGGNPNEGTAKGGGPPPTMYMAALHVELDEW